MNYILNLKSHFENLTSGQGHDRKRSCCISVSPYGRFAHIYGGRFHRSSWFLSKVIAEKQLVIFHDLK